MQPLHKPSDLRGQSCAEEVMGAVPPVVWYMRGKMRRNRGQLSMPQFRALVRIECDAAASITDIADHLGTSLSTTSRVISGLVRRKFLARNIARGDRRRATLALTSKGSAVLESARQATRGELQLVFQSLASTEQAKVIEAMQILRRLFGSLPAPKAPTHASRNGNDHGERRHLSIAIIRRQDQR